MDSTLRPPAVSGRRLLLVVPLGVGLCIVALALTVLAIALLGGRGWAARHGPTVGALATAEVYLALLAALALLFGGLPGLRDRLGFRFTSIADLGLALAAWVGALIAGALLTAALQPLLGAAKSNALPIVAQSFDPLFVGLIVPTVALLAPFCEELLFRGALYGWLRRRLPAVVAAAISAALFSGAHLLPPLFPFLFTFGLAAALIRERTGSTLNSFAMHACQNTLALAAAYLVLTRG